MKIEKLDAHLGGTLTESGITQYNEFQSAFISKVKAGGDLIFVSPTGTGRTTAIALASIIKSPQPEEGSPRVLVFSHSIDSAHKLFQALVSLVRRTDIKLELAHDKGNMVLERNNIFDGADILIGNPKKLLKLYLQNGYHIGKIKAVIIDNADEICKDSLQIQDIARIVESLPKCQRVLVCRELTPKVQKLAEMITVHPSTCEL